jgi:hypothetical protein
MYIAIFVLLIGALGTLTYFQLSKFWTCKEKISGLEKERAAAQVLLDEIPGLRKEAKALSDQIEVYAEILPKEQEVRHDAFVETMDRFARETGLQILRADPFERKNAKRAAAPTGANAEKKAAPPFSEHSYVFELIGTFPNFLRFLNKIENWDRFLAVEEVEINPEGMSKFGSSGGGGKVDAKDIDAAQKPMKSIQLVVTTYTHTPKQPSATAERKM